MLGVRRTTVTVEAHTLQSAGLIKYARGKIQIVDAKALQDGACECYETVKRHYARLLGPPKKAKGRDGGIECQCNRARRPHSLG